MLWITWTLLWVPLLCLGGLAFALCFYQMIEDFKHDR